MKIVKGILLVIVAIGLLTNPIGIALSIVVGAVIGIYTSLQPDKNTINT